MPGRDVCDSAGVRRHNRGLNPNIWFNNVERVASERIGRETVTYVTNIYKYDITYRLVSDQMSRREATKAGLGKRK